MPLSPIQLLLLQQIKFYSCQLVIQNSEIINKYLKNIKKQYSNMQNCGWNMHQYWSIRKKYLSKQRINQLIKFVQVKKYFYLRLRAKLERQGHIFKEEPKFEIPYGPILLLLQYFPNQFVSIYQ
ncbi:hypothetical protein TTHERM_000181048 (macronuclear) [Tetrahymena thermophila SB210]|uniref:Uncharacterized protein n=1 Tax=Tetrahymena thermophila (strain SB210) TaxID=312017 RepID=W7X9X7_TETTS|nr:hypothetical protein TTHERM_000181048 [Tetrahymena thermophila SB210]EWS76215.1 hypothetical protein TTHERM_000181048 [Tetrahymena thermophila SB210]|eukprot:XP_012651262.1 hypothetical protein TTHERM_000181048 [Tetrahymena thermophila SB210]